MHEASQVRALLSRILSVAGKECATRVSRVEIAIGPFAHARAEHLARHLREAARGTGAEGALFDVREGGPGLGLDEVRIERVEIEE